VFLGKAFEIYADAYASETVLFYPSVTLRESDIEANFGRKPFKFLPALLQQGTVQEEVLTPKNWFEAIPTDIIIVKYFFQLE
jgi:hypothetical protein